MHIALQILLFVIAAGFVIVMTVFMIRIFDKVSETDKELEEKALINQLDHKYINQRVTKAKSDIDENTSNDGIFAKSVREEIASLNNTLRTTQSDLSSLNQGTQQNFASMRTTTSNINTDLGGFKTKTSKDMQTVQEEMRDDIVLATDHLSKNIHSYVKQEIDAIDDEWTTKYADITASQSTMSQQLGVVDARLLALTNDIQKIDTDLSWLTQKVNSS
jgi:hypothetical protein